MNNDKISRIATFIESLPIDDSLADCQSTLLTTNMDMMGAGTNNGACTNDMYDQCHKSTNGGACQNYSSACTDTTNRGACVNTHDGPPPKPTKPVGPPEE